MYVIECEQGQPITRMQEMNNGTLQEQIRATQVESGVRDWWPLAQVEAEDNVRSEQQQVLQVELEPEPPTTPQNTPATENNTATAVDEVLPQQASFWSTFGGCSTFFIGMWLGTSWLIIGPATFFGIMIGAPNLAPVASIIAVVIWWTSYFAWYLPRVYYPGRPYVPCLDSDGRPITQEAGGQVWVKARKESSFLKWREQFVPIEIFPIGEEEESE